MTAQLSMFAAPRPTPKPLPPPEPRYGWRWRRLPIGGKRDVMCEPREGVTAFVEYERWFDAGKLVESFEWKVIGLGPLQKGEALTFDDAASAARKVVGDDSRQATQRAQGLP